MTCLNLFKESESSTLRALSTFKFRSKPLPEMLPFPFKPDERQDQR